MNNHRSIAWIALEFCINAGVFILRVFKRTWKSDQVAAKRFIQLNVEMMISILEFKQFPNWFDDIWQTARIQFIGQWVMETSTVARTGLIFIVTNILNCRHIYQINNIDQISIRRRARNCGQIKKITTQRMWFAYQTIASNWKIFLIKFIQYLFLYWYNDIRNANDSWNKWIQCVLNSADCLYWQIFFHFQTMETMKIRANYFLLDYLIFCRLNVAVVMMA